MSAHAITGRKHIITNLDGQFNVIKQYIHTRNYFVYLYGGYEFKFSGSADHYGRPCGKPKLSVVGRLFKNEQGQVVAFQKFRNFDTRSSLESVKKFIEEAAAELDEKYAEVEHIPTFEAK